MTKNAQLVATLCQERAALLIRYDQTDSVKGLARLFEDICRALREADRQATALRKHAEALSEISAMCGPPNKMGLSMYDVDPHPDVVVEQVRAMLDRDAFPCCGGNDDAARRPPRKRHHCSDCAAHPWVDSPDPRCVDDPSRCSHATKTKPPHPGG